jgi:Type I phosphodiesterase / nucleotide pyrophosphatase
MSYVIPFPPLGASVKHPPGVLPSFCGLFLSRFGIELNGSGTSYELSGKQTMKAWLGLAIAGLLAAPCAQAETARRKKVLIIGIDGTMPAALAVAYTPNLDALQAEGAFTDRAITHPVTHSAACWSSMFTGVWGDKHGVNDPGNSFAGNRFDLYPNFMSRLETVNSNLNTLAFLRWAPLVTALSGTDLVRSFETDAAIAAATVDELTTGDPDVFFTILLDVDSAGHAYGWGPDVPQYVQAIETADGRVGEIMQALTERPTYAQENWLVIILTDHGQHDSTVERARLIFHLLWGPDVAPGTMLPTPSMVDVCASVLNHMDVAIDPAWNLDARPEGFPLPRTAYGTNLIMNGDAEFNSGTNNYTPNRGIAWWWDYDSITLGNYGSNPAFPTLDSPGSTNRGNQFFLGGTATASMSQTIDISDRAVEFDEADVDYVLSGWFGGTGTQEDSATLTARFLDENSSSLGMASIGTVTAAERGGITGLLERSAAGTVPVGTRRKELARSWIWWIPIRRLAPPFIAFKVDGPEDGIESGATLRSLLPDILQCSPTAPQGARTALSARTGKEPASIARTRPTALWEKKASHAGWRSTSRSCWSGAVVGRAGLPACRFREHPAPSPRLGHWLRHAVPPRAARMPPEPAARMAALRIGVSARTG